jgi:hypothetical protein
MEQAQTAAQRKQGGRQEIHSHKRGEARGLAGILRTGRALRTHHYFKEGWEAIPREVGLRRGSMGWVAGFTARGNSTAGEISASPPAKAAGAARGAQPVLAVNVTNERWPCSDGLPAKRMISKLARSSWTLPCTLGPLTGGQFALP